MKKRTEKANGDFLRDLRERNPGKLRGQQDQKGNGYIFPSTLHERGKAGCTSRRN